MSLRTTRSINSIRIHIKRAIERLMRDFCIFQENLLIPLVPLADKILTVCASFFYLH